jgi:hypothetical protein
LRPKIVIIGTSRVKQAFDPEKVGGAFAPAYNAEIDALQISEARQPAVALLKSCTMIITEPNAMVAEVHDRMPVVLEADQFTPWLENEAGLEILAPAAEGVLERWPVSKRVNVLPVIRELQSAGATSHNAIAMKLNDRKVPTRRGSRWTHVQVAAVLARSA